MAFHTFAFTVIVFLLSQEFEGTDQKTLFVQYISKYVNKVGGSLMPWYIKVKQLLERSTESEYL